MNINYRSLANDYISSIVPYQPGKPIEEVERELGISSAIKLASNENALGPSKKAIEAAQTALIKSHFYPDASCYALKKELSSFLKVSSDQLTIGNGSENVLEIIINSYLGYGDEAIVSQYAFLTIPLLIKSRGGKIIQVPALNFGHDTQNMIKAVTEKTRIIFIVNPNNPTGTYINHHELKHVLESIPPTVLVVIDEAYQDYVNIDDYPDSIQLLKEYPNLVITRTFSKIYGLAALRLGYSVSSPEIADILNRARLPFNVNSIAAIAAREALLDQDHVANTILMNKQGMLQIEDSLKKQKIEYIPSLGNFITINIKANAAEIYQKLMHKGIIVRPLAIYDLTTFLRITIGTLDQNELFLSSFQHVMRN